TDYESRMMGHLREVSYFYDSRRPTNDEMRIVKYNNAFYIDPSKSERVRKLFQYAETVVTIIDENPKATIQKLRKNNTCFVKRSETTKALGTIVQSIKNFLQVAKIVNKSPDELNTMLSLSTLSDQ
ncbi:4498_t:CDS:2, partial [Racocetra persica]